MRLGLGLLCVIEASQLFVVSRFSSTTHLATGLVGVAAGWTLAWWRISSAPADSSAAQRQASLTALAIAMVYALLVALVLTVPYDHICSAGEARERWAALWSRPLLSVLQAGAIENAVAQALRKILLFGTAGALAAMAIWPFPHRSRSWWQALAAATALMFGLAFGIEAVQVWLIPHVPDLSDALLAVLACGLGMGGILVLAAVRTKTHLEPPPHFIARIS
jgi:glycopeptide antibiotics resistance protein